MNMSHTSSPHRRAPFPARRLLLALGITLLASATSATATVRYVSPTGGGTGTQASPWSLAQANASTGLQPGDTARLMAGTYTNQQIAPVNNGSSGLPITYIKDAGTVTLLGSPNGQPQVQLTNKSWIVVDGLTLDSAINASSVQVLSATHCTVQNCTIARASGVWAGISVGTFPPVAPNSYLTIRNCTFADSNYTGSAGGPTGDQIYHVYSHHTLIDNCTFGKSPHQAINIQRGSSFVIVQNCTARNIWHTNVEAFTGDAENGGPAEGLSYVVYQDNRLYDNAIAHATNPRYGTPGYTDSNGLEIEMRNCIARRNVDHRSDPYGTNYLYQSDGLTLTCWGGQSSTANRIYHNVVAGHGRGLYIDGKAGNVVQDNVWKNNIFYQNTQNDVYTGTIGGTVTTALQSLFAYNNFYSPGINSLYKGTAGSIATIQSAFPTEWQNNLGLNPQFTSVANRDFTLQSGSPMIDAGDFLTTAANSASSPGTSLVVADANYFCDGYGLIPGDTIRIGAQTATISSVDYGTNTITLTAATTWSSGAGVSLPYNGAKPDIGAFESTSGGSVPAAPSTLTATTDGTNPASQINLSWENVANETGYSVERKTGAGGSYAEVTTTATDIVTLEDGSLSSGTPYYYRVRSYNANGYSASYSPEANATTDSGGTGAFQMSGNQVVMEAEHATTRTAGTPTVRNWTDITESGASGGASNNAVQALPNSGGSVTPGPGPAACRADYQINVPAGSAASFYVHLRGRAASGTDDSVYVSIDGGTAAFLTLFPPQAATLGVWVSAGTLSIPSGTHTVTLWMREDGAIIDKIVVKDNATLPTGTGPAESSQGGTNSVPVITTTTLPGTIAGESYSQTLAATDGDGTLVWTVDAGSLPAGLSLSTGGVISGNATTAGTANFTVRVADSDGVTGSSDEDTQALSLVVTANSVPSITTTTLPGTIIGEAYSQTLAATGGNGALTWSVSAGALPAGLSLSSAGVLGGSATTAGTANFTVRVADSDGVTGSSDEDTQALSLVVTANSVPSITTTTLPAGTTSTSYSQTLAATGGNGALVWSLASGSLPAGLSLSSGGVVSGTPTASGTANFTVRVADSDGVTGSSDEDTQALSLVINAGPFQMVSNQVVMEAEHATTRIAGTPTAYNWTDVTESGASGAGSNNAIQSLPNATDVSVATPGAAACRADYQITVPAGSAAAFYVHVRGRGADGADNSINVSIDGSTATYQTIGNLPTGGTLGAWVVSPGTLAIPSGTHTVTVWMRENGAIIDKLVVKNNTTLPTGTGPAESPQ